MTNGGGNHGPKGVLAQEVQVDDLWRRIETIDAKVTEIRELLTQPESQRDWYSIAEVAKLLSRAEFTVREWARLGRIYASKRACGRGSSQEWMISAKEVDRIRNEGLLPN